MMAGTSLTNSRTRTATVCIMPRHLPGTMRLLMPVLAAAFSGCITSAHGQGRMGQRAGGSLVPTSRAPVNRSISRARLNRLQAANRYFWGSASKSLSQLVLRNTGFVATIGRVGETATVAEGLSVDLVPTI